MTYQQLRQSMPDRELLMWVRYRNQRRFPQHRLELMLAQLTRWVAMVAGQTDAKTEDFMLEFAAAGTTPPDREADVDALQQAFNFAPRVVRRKGR